MSIQEIYNYIWVDEQISTAGQPTAQQFISVAEDGFQTIINLAPYNPEHSIEDEAGLVRSLGLRYVHIPVNWDMPLESDFETFEIVLKGLSAGRTLIHCVANYRASAFYALYAQKNLAWSEQQAETFRAAIWKGSDYPVWDDLIARIRMNF